MTSYSDPIWFSVSSLLSLSPDDPAIPGYLSVCPWLAQKPVTLSPLLPANSSACLVLFGSVSHSTYRAHFLILSQETVWRDYWSCCQSCPHHWEARGPGWDGNLGTAHLGDQVHDTLMRLASWFLEYPP